MFIGQLQKFGLQGTFVSVIHFYNIVPACNLQLSKLFSTTLLPAGVDKVRQIFYFKVVPKNFHQMRRIITMDDAVSINTVSQKFAGLCC